MLFASRVAANDTGCGARTDPQSSSRRSEPVSSHLPKVHGGNEKAELSISSRGDARSSLSHPDGETARRAWLKNGFDRGKLGVGCQDGRGERGARHTVGDRSGYWGGTMVSFMMTWLGVGMGYVFYEACWEYGWLGLVWGWNFGTCRDMFFLLGMSSAVD